MTDLEFYTLTLENPFNAELLRRLLLLDFPDCQLTASCLFQTIWNHLSQNHPTYGIKDYDIFYYDASDLSWEAEDRIIKRLAEATADLPISVEIKNQARVHIWYKERFGGDYPLLHSARDGIDRYLISCTCVGIGIQNSDLYAPNGLNELLSGTLRINPLNPQPDLFLQKAESYKLRWPWLEIAN